MTVITVTPKPLSVALRTSTWEAHMRAEHDSGPFFKNLIGGQLVHEQYVAYLVGLYFVYSTLEETLSSHAPTNSILSTIYFPNELNRTDSILSDLARIQKFKPSSTPISLPPSPKLMTPAIQSYVARIQKIGETKPELLIAHAYVRYLGDLSGGQLLSRAIPPPYHPPPHPSYSTDPPPLTFHSFPAIVDTREFKKLYRLRLDEVPDVGGVLHGLIVEEANGVFGLNRGFLVEVGGCGGF
ncbi:heme oxygenase (decycling) 1 [Rhizophlyctis rosea]|nr:heme oxygenase (decycling) 1 [Rhizophlyctis rosea]